MTQSHTHGHSHHLPDPTLVTTRRGIWAVKWSFVALLATACVQVAIVAVSGSVALLADTLHNFGDALTALPLWFAFALASRGGNHRFPYGYGRLEDFAGLLIVGMILASAVVVAYEVLVRVAQPQPVKHLAFVAFGAIVGVAGNEAVARFRFKIGAEIGSEALIADGHHARADALTSLAVLLSAAGLWLGYPWADPLIGGLIAIVILRIAWVSGKPVILRLLDAVDPKVVGEIKEAARRTAGVVDVTEARVRWLGHRMHAELNVAVEPGLTIEEGHDIALGVRHALLHHLRYLSDAIVHVDPTTASGEDHHRIGAHAHDELPTHSH